MPLFGPPKPTITASAYARWFHEIGDQDAEAWLLGAGQAVAEKDQRFGGVVFDDFKAEMLALRSELFGLAWGYAFAGRDGHLFDEGIVAKDVLGHRGLWGRGDRYNLAVARSRETTQPRGQRMARAFVMGQNEIVYNLALTYAKQGRDKEVAVRIINRLFTEGAWKKGETLRYLVAELIQATGFVDSNGGDPLLNPDALTAIQVLLLDIYEGSQQGIAKMNIKSG